jgi:ABC-2 type transport system ATP-binding protein
MSDFIIETNGLRRVFSGHAAVDGLDLKVPTGSIFGFLGRNGAGKTTIRLLLGFLKSGGGEVRLFDELITGPGSAAIRQRIGYVSENKDLYPYWTVEQIIRFTKSFSPTGGPISNAVIWNYSICHPIAKYPLYQKGCAPA